MTGAPETHSPGRPRVLVVSRHFSHYRHGLVRALQDRSDIDVEFAGGTAVSIDGIDAMPLTAFHCYHRLQARRAGPLRFHWGILPLITRRRFSAVVVSGDIADVTIWLACLILRARGIPVLLWTIGWHRPESGVKRIVRLAFYRLANRLLVYGEDGRRIGIAQGYPSARISVVGNSHESRSVGPTADPDLDLPADGPPVIGAVIRLTPRKRLDLLLRAAAELADRGRPVLVLLAGDGPARPSLEELARQLGVELRILGPTYGETALDRVYSALRVTVVPCAAGLTVIQSLAHGTPVVSDSDRHAQMPEWSAIVPGITGDHYTPGDAAALADAVDRWLSRTAAKPAKVAADCRAEAEAHWSASAHAARIVDAVRAEIR
jgi:glycosyltransferase involved in cell wall biosynthesis